MSKSRWEDMLRELFKVSRSQMIAVAKAINVTKKEPENSSTEYKCSRKECKRILSLLITLWPVIAKEEEVLI